MYMLMYEHNFFYLYLYVWAFIYMINVQSTHIYVM